MTANSLPSPTEMIVKPEVMLLGDVLDAISRGNLRVPRFQRPFVWRPDQMLELFDSIERGYPIGSLLVWETNLPLASLGMVGDIAVPEPPPGTPVSFLLDGHQRLSTLFGALMRPATAVHTTEQRSWMWWVYRELGGGRPSRLLFRQVENYLANMKEFALGGPPPDGHDETARPFPDRFDLRSARIKAMLLWELADSRGVSTRREILSMSSSFSRRPIRAPSAIS